MQQFLDTLKETDCFFEILRLLKVFRTLLTKVVTVGGLPDYHKRISEMAARKSSVILHAVVSIPLIGGLAALASVVATGLLGAVIVTAAEVLGVTLFWLSYWRRHTPQAFRRTVTITVPVVEMAISVVGGITAGPDSQHVARSIFNGFIRAIVLGLWLWTGANVANRRINLAVGAVLGALCWGEAVLPEGLTGGLITALGIDRTVGVYALSAITLPIALLGGMAIAAPDAVHAIILHVRTASEWDGRKPHPLATPSPERELANVQPEVGQHEDDQASRSVVTASSLPDH